MHGCVCCRLSVLCIRLHGVRTHCCVVRWAMDTAFCWVDASAGFFMHTMHVGAGAAPSSPDLVGLLAAPSLSCRGVVPSSKHWVVHYRVLDSLKPPYAFATLYTCGCAMCWWTLQHTVKLASCRLCYEHNIFSLLTGCLCHSGVPHWPCKGHLI